MIYFGFNYFFQKIGRIVASYGTLSGIESSLENVVKDALTCLNI